jgi:cell wall-associated NlpC family hydrolase
MSAVLIDSRSELEQRSAVIAEAIDWLHTPWVHQANIKGEAVDCAMSLIEWFYRARIIAWFDPRPYPRSWFVHQDEEIFLNTIVNHFRCTEIAPAAATPGDLVLYRLGRCYAHGALVVEPKLVIHAFAKNGKVIYTETFDPDLSSRSPRAFNPWGRR